MKVRISKITKKGQITIPNEIRKRLNIKHEDYLAITLEKDYILIKKVELPSWKSLFKEGERISKEKNITLNDVLEACKEARHSP
ncbi:MAG: AbrB/MazE/SpoVT family DNA-binding domain-containing protein [Promethearchaeota archaeon]|nr:MAG: AbrB/MazE/SpoVT family DNA-binding domain-containing protein [Candidatus Lokiarchaeota archaeon]